MEAFDSNAYKRYQNFNFYCGQRTKEQMRILGILHGNESFFAVNADHES
jgi:hypothetical protein